MMVKINKKKRQDNQNSELNTEIECFEKGIKAGF